MRDAAIAALMEAALTVGPGGKQNSFASRARATYAMCERGPQQPRSLAVAFIKPVSRAGHHEESVEQLTTFRDRLDGAYGPCADARYTMDVMTGEGNMAGLIAFALV